MGAVLPIIFGCVCGVVGYFLMKSGFAADPNEVGKIVGGIILELICLFIVGIGVFALGD